jgi:hypothetical protein
MNGDKVKQTAAECAEGLPGTVMTLSNVNCTRGAVLVGDPVRHPERYRRPVLADFDPDRPYDRKGVAPV